MDLAKFLLARLIEDVRMAERGAIVHCPSGLYLSGSPTSGLLGISGHRLLAECKAKRRIVERAVETEPPYADAYQQEVHETLTDDVLPLLALPYADHPDYRPEWKP